MELIIMIFIWGCLISLPAFLITYYLFQLRPAEKRAEKILAEKFNHLNK